MNDYTFASALLATRSANLFTKNQFRDLKGCDDQAFVHKLQSFGYGVSLKNVMVDALVESELLKMKEELLEMLPNDDITMFFFTRYDLTNIRNFYKKKLFNIDLDTFEKAGSLSQKDLEKAILRDDYFAISEPYKTLFVSLAGRSFASTGELINVIQATFQNLLYEQIVARKDESLLTYFVISTDISNLLTLLRTRRLKLSIEQLRLGLLGHGLLDSESIVAMYALDDKEVMARYSSLYMSRFALLISQYFDDKDFVNLEHGLMKILLEELKPLQLDIRSSAILIEYVVRKQIEIIDIRRLYLDRNATLMVNA